MHSFLFWFFFLPAVFIHSLDPIDIEILFTSVSKIRVRVRLLRWPHGCLQNILGAFCPLLGPALTLTLTLETLANKILAGWNIGSGKISASNISSFGRIEHNVKKLKMLSI